MFLFIFLFFVTFFSAQTSDSATAKTVFVTDGAIIYSLDDNFNNQVAEDQVIKKTRLVSNDHNQQVEETIYYGNGFAEKIAEKVAEKTASPTKAIAANQPSKAIQKKAAKKIKHQVRPKYFVQNSTGDGSSFYFAKEYSISATSNENNNFQVQAVGVESPQKTIHNLEETIKPLFAKNFGGKLSLCIFFYCNRPPPFSVC